MMGAQKLAPRAEEIKKKYANNKAEMNRQMGKLYKEQGLAPFLGCAPMFLQMPIWIALYGAILANIDLRGAQFLPVWITDLSAPDALFYFGSEIPYIGTSFNLLPVLMGVAMFLQQKYMPHTAAAKTDPSQMTDQQKQMAQQQKMMQWMFPIMMLVFLYKAPSGLNLYIMTSVFAGVWEQKIIRKHVQDKQEQENIGRVSVTSKTGGKIKKKKPKPFYKNHH